MDGVLANFDKAAELIIGTDNIYKWEWIHGEKAFWGKLNEFPNFFRDLELLPDARKLWANVSHLRPIILTALPSTNASVVEQHKRDWIEEHFGIIPQVLACRTSEKPNWCRCGDVIVDDRATNQESWVAKGGHYIVHTSTDLTLLHLGRLGLL